MFKDNPKIYKSCYDFFYEIKAILLEKFADVVATKNKGQIMKVAMPELKGKADGKVINQIVSEIVAKTGE